MNITAPTQERKAEIIGELLQEIRLAIDNKKYNLYHKTIKLEQANKEKEEARAQANANANREPTTSEIIQDEVQKQTKTLVKQIKDLTNQLGGGNRGRGNNRERGRGSGRGRGASYNPNNPNNPHISNHSNNNGRGSNRGRGNK